MGTNVGPSTILEGEGYALKARLTRDSIYPTPTDMIGNYC